MHKDDRFWAFIGLPFSVAALCLGVWVATDPEPLATWSGKEWRVPL